MDYTQQDYVGLDCTTLWEPLVYGNVHLENNFGQAGFHHYLCLLESVIYCSRYLEMWSKNRFSTIWK